jgi:peptidoglycan/xylan/chitin deacetylase (PgdA/CDA1 family)
MGLILLYHRVCELASDPQRLAVSPDRFSKQLEVLDAHFRLMELPVLMEQASRHALPSDAVAVTFDDGYADNLEYAQPLLEKWRVPATVFVATGYIGGDREFWWDDLERLLLTEGCLPRLLRLTIGTDTREWNLDGAADYDAAMYARHRSWHVEEREDPTPRHRVYRELCGRLRSCSPAVRDDLLRELSDQARGTAGPRPTHRALSANEVRQLNRGPSIDIGAHSASHAALSALPLDEQKEEILSSRSAVERLTGCMPGAFAYPFGTASDYTRATVGHVREAGFSCACVATPGKVEPGGDPLRLPRLIVRDWDRDLFEDRLREWL